MSESNPRTAAENPSPLGTAGNFPVKEDAQPDPILSRYNQRLRERAERVLPGGVNSPVRSFAAVGIPPIFIQRAEGAHLWDCDGRRLTDYIGSWGVFAAGHAHPQIVDALISAVRDGSAYGLTSKPEIELAEEICRRIPLIEKVRFVNSGTEAVMSALRLARGATGRDLTLKFDGCYHGHSDALLVRSGSGPMTLGRPDSDGVASAVAATTITATYNDLDSVEARFEQFPGQIAAVVVEPVAGNMGVVPPRPGFLEGLRALCSAHGALLVFDEVMTGFRVAHGGAQERFEIQPDLTCLGKIIGGGLPIGAFGGRSDLMQKLAPEGPVYQAGTMSGNPLAMRAGLATLQLLDHQRYEDLENTSARFQSALERSLPKCAQSFSVQRVGSMMSIFFGVHGAQNLDQVLESDDDAFGRLFAHLLDHQILIPPSPYESWFISLAHGEREIQSFESALQSFQLSAS